MKIDFSPHARTHFFVFIIYILKTPHILRENAMKTNISFCMIYFIYFQFSENTIYYNNCAVCWEACVLFGCCTFKRISAIILVKAFLFEEFVLSFYFKYNIFWFSCIWNSIFKCRSAVPFAACVVLWFCVVCATTRVSFFLAKSVSLENLLLKRKKRANMNYDFHFFLYV